MTVTVVNVRKEDNNIYCGRGSALGNPFVLGRDGDRNEVCDKYKTYFDKQVGASHQTHFNMTLDHLVDIAANGDVNLGCYCAPQRCHCDTIKSYIDNKLEEHNNGKSI